MMKYSLSKLLQMAMRALIIFFLLLAVLPCDVRAEESAAPSGTDVPSQAWHNLDEFDAITSFSVAGPPMREDAERAKEETELYEDMANHFDDIENDNDEEYDFIAQALLDVDDPSIPASLRQEDVSEDMMAEENMIKQIDTFGGVDDVRPTFIPGVHIQPRKIMPDKKDSKVDRSLFAEIPQLPPAGSEDKPIEAIMNSEAPIEKSIKPSYATDVPPAEKAGTINAPAKKPVTSPDEETLHALKEAVKDLGADKHLNLGNKIGTHLALENKAIEGAAPEAATIKNTEKTRNHDAALAGSGKKNPRKSQRRKKSRSDVPQESVQPSITEQKAIPEKKEESIFDIF